MKPEEILAELKVAKERIEFLEKELKKPKKFEFNYEKGNTVRLYQTTIELKYDGNDYKSRDFGLYRISADNAKEAVQLNKESSLIGAIAEQIDVNYSKNIDWNNNNNPKYSIYYNYRIKAFSFYCNSYIRALGTVYMSEKIAEKVCEILNNKEVEL